MFHWICPECGREIAPTVRECPVCDPVAATVETALAGEVEAPARAEKEVAEPAVRVSSPAAGNQPEPEQYQPITAVVAPTTVVTPVHSPPPALATRIASVSPLAARSSTNLADALVPQFGAPTGGGDPLDHLSSMLVSSMLVSSMLDSRREPSPPEPPPSRDALPLPWRAASNVPASLRAFIAELGPVGAEPRIPMTPEQRRQIAAEPPLFTKSIPLPLRPARQAAAPPLGAKLLPQPAEPSQAVHPSSNLGELAPPLAPLGNYSPLAGRPLRPANPRVQLLKKECGPRTTLPGPMLTRRLVKFMDRELGPIPPVFLLAKKRLIPGWMATALILGTLLGAGFTSVISMVRPAAEAKASPAAQTSTPSAALPESTVVSSVSAAPLAKAIEVTGFRIQMDSAKKSEIQYLVVNHTPARFSGVTVYVTLYAPDAKAGQSPLCKFQFTAPNLAPYQSKDMTSAIERVSPALTLPDWQDLRASVEIGE
jgi:hypothetical protein